MINYYKGMVLLTLFSLCGCVRGGVPTTYPVRVPVGVSCIAGIPAEPQWNLPHLQNNADDVLRLRAVLADRLLAKGFIEELKAVLAGCQ